MTAKPLFFDVSDPDGPGLNPNRAVTWLIDRLTDNARNNPDWVTDPGADAVTLTVLAHQPGRRAEIGFSAAGLEGTVTLSPHPEGWLAITATLAGEPVFQALLDQPYEEYELRPAGTSPAEPPGRIGKRANWISLSTEAWPIFKALAPEGYFNIQVVERQA